MEKEYFVTNSIFKKYSSKNKFYLKKFLKYYERVIIFLFLKFEILPSLAKSSYA
jgi:hypothetical protein